jgi:hypothetical protein
LRRDRGSAAGTIEFSRAWLRHVALGQLLHPRLTRHTSLLDRCRRSRAGRGQKQSAGDRERNKGDQWVSTPSTTTGIYDFDARPHCLTKIIRRFLRCIKDSP